MKSDRSHKPNGESQGKPWARRRRTLIFAIVFLFATPAIFIAATRLFMDKRYEEKLSALRASGVPTTPSEIQNWRIPSPPSLGRETREAESAVAVPPASDEKAAIPSYIAAFEAIDRINKTPGMPDIGKILERLHKNGKLSGEELAEVKKYLAAHEDALKLLLDAAGLASGRFSLDYSKGFAMELPHLAKLREAERMLHAAAYVAALEGDRDRAFDAIMAGMAINTPLQQEPILISQLVRCACNNIAMDSFAETLGMVEYTDAQLAQLQRAFQAGHDPQALANAFICERAFGIAAFDNPAEILQARTLLDELMPGATTTLIQTASAVGWFDMDRAAYMTHMDAMIQASTLPYAESIAAMNRIAEEVGEPFLIPTLSQYLMPALSRTADYMTANDARMREGMTAVAVERYVLANGAPPDRLEALTPAYLPEVPADPFDNQPLRYRREGDSYVLYSIGPNNADDGGTTGNSSNEGDIVFRTHGNAVL